LLSLAAQDSVLVRPDSTHADSAALADTTRADTTVARADTTHAAATDSAKARVRPGSVLWRSLLLPGWGQMRLGRKLTAGFFVLAEGVTLGMSLKANSDLRHLRQIGADTATINAQSRKREDWLVLLGVNHLLAGLEAFIAANLTDFPAELRFRREPGGFGASLRIPVRVR